ncbi:hypothetical protein KJ682_17580 [bacterium]|nr:hypothetical protein [bacterium]
MSLDRTVKNRGLCWGIIAGIALALTGCQEDGPTVPRPLSGAVAITVSPDTLPAPWRLEDPVGRWSAGVGDTVLEGSSVGRYRLVWDRLDDWIGPEIDLVVDSLAAGDTLWFRGAFSPRPAWATLKLTAEPAGLQAPWTVEGPDDYLASGTENPARLSGLSPGAYRVVWGEVTGWTHLEPPAADYILAAGDSLEASHAYAEITGAVGDLSVGVFPAEFDAGWVLSGSNGFWAGSGGTTLAGIPIGTYQITWEQVPGYEIFPSLVQAVTIRQDALTFTSAFYLYDSSRAGTIRIETVPPDVAIPWLLTGPGDPHSGEGSGILSSMIPGDYTIVWGELAGFQAPANPTERFFLAEYDTVTVAGTYLSEAPLAVLFIGLESTGVPGRIEIIWWTSPPTVHPLESFLIGFSPEGPIDEAGWDQAVILAEEPAVSDRLEYSLFLEPDTSGLIPGLPVWFAVRAVDTLGQLSPIEGEHFTVLPFLADATGRVTDHLGAPLAGVPVRLTLQNGGLAEAVTDPAGRFAFTEFLGDSRLAIETGMGEIQPGLFFDYRFIPTAGDDLEDIPIVLLPRHAMDVACVHQTRNFLHYFREMTNTIQPTNNRPDTRLNKWETWPLVVYIPPDPETGSPPFQAMSSGAVALWNQIMGETFVLTGDSGAAQVVFRFADDIPQVNGQVSILLPPGGGFIGDVIPEKMEVYINTVITNQQRIMEVALHELGHVLGVADHSTCSAAGYLMYISSAGVLDDGPENAIHPDEQLLVKAIRGLPQGVDTSGYIED